MNSDEDDTRKSTGNNVRLRIFHVSEPISESGEMQRAGASILGDFSAGAIYVRTFPSRSGDTIWESTVELELGCDSGTYCD